MDDSTLERTTGSGPAPPGNQSMNSAEKNGKDPSAIDLAVEQELIAILFGSPAVPLINGVVILFTVGVLWRVFPKSIALSWLCVGLCVVVWRVLLWVQYSRHGIEIRPLKEWARLYNQSTAVMGCLWGLTAATVFVAHDPIDYFFAAFAVGGLSAGAAVRNSPYPPSFYVFVGTAVPPMILALFLRGQMISFAMAWMLVTFVGVMVLIGRENHQRLNAYIRLKIEQQDLNASLQKVTLDLTEQNAALSERSELLDNAQDAIYVLDTDARILYWNKGAERMFGWTQKELIGRVIGDVFPDGRELMVQALAQVGEEGRWSGEISKRDKFGSELTVTSRCTLVGNSGEGPRSIFVINTDVTEQKLSRARIHRLAYYDEVTGLPNRVLLRERLQNALQTSRMTGQTGALFFIDMDDFKTLNDTAGHDVGDLLLEQIAGRLISAVRTNDCVARLGGDEFVVMVEGLGKDLGAAGVRAQSIGAQILLALREVYHLHTYDYQCTASVGLALIGDDSTQVDDLLKRADMAMYRSKEQGRNMVCVFNPEMEQDLASRAALIADLRRALECREFELLYQAQVDSDGKVLGCEALVRWRHPQRGLISPADFIPVAESGGMILELGAHVLEEACRRLAMWTERVALRDLTIAVNVSSRQFADPHFVGVVQHVLQDTRVDPSRLKLEITESAAMENVSDVIEKMKTLKALGIQISLDDFGTGYSSLSQLKLLPLNQLKIDKSFVNDVVTSVLDASIVKTIIDLGRNLNLDVIAEGVETEEQLQFLKVQGCRRFQGYLFSVPLSAVAFETYTTGMQPGSGDTKGNNGGPKLQETVSSGPASISYPDPNSWRPAPICATNEIPGIPLHR
jgi:diguanylate cyclase (GGDEF)-like protein/PAS domain S-box-containing protein